MKRQLSYHVIGAVLFLAVALRVTGQGTAISYQGRLSEGGSPANTNFDFRFAVFNAPTNGSLASGWVTNFGVPVSNGLFSVKLDFGAGIFDGTANGSNDWLDVAVRAAGAAAFTELTPRQPMLPAPYALFAVSASNLLGTLAVNQLAGTIASLHVGGAYSNAVDFVNGSNTFAGTFSGNAAALTNLNASAIASGTLADARLASNVALLDTNQTYTGTNAYNSPVTFNAGDTFNGSNTFNGPNYFGAANFFRAVNTFTNNSNYFIGSFFGNGLVGWIPVYSPSTNAMRDAGYLTLNAGLSTVTLPTAPLLVGDIVRVSGGGGGGWQVQENSGQSILGNFAAYRNGVLGQLGQAPTGDGYGVAASADGRQIYLVGGDLIGVYGSSDGGETWSEVSGTHLSGYWTSVACSANGRIVYAETAGGDVQKSSDGGVTWSSTTTSATASFISCTADGGTLFTGGVACSGNGTYRARLSGNAVGFSTNSGSSWTTISTAPANVFCLAVSSDCNRMVAGVSNGMLYASSNLGATWTVMMTNSQNWSGAWMAPDGSKFAATFSKSGGAAGGVYLCTVSALPGTVNTNSTIGGSQGSAVELQYLGNGQFMPVGSAGLLWSN